MSDFLHHLNEKKKFWFGLIARNKSSKFSQKQIVNNRESDYSQRNMLNTSKISRNTNFFINKYYNNRSKYQLTFFLASYYQSYNVYQNQNSAFLTYQLLFTTIIRRWTVLYQCYSAYSQSQYYQSQQSYRNQFLNVQSSQRALSSIQSLKQITTKLVNEPKNDLKKKYISNRQQFKSIKSRAYYKKKNNANKYDENKYYKNKFVAKTADLHFANYNEF